MRVRSALAALALVAGTAEAQSVDTAATRTDSARVTRLETINVTAERPRAAAPPVTTIEVAPAELRRTFSADAYDLLRRTSGIEVHEQGQGPGFASDAVIRGFSSDHSSDVLLTIDGVPINLPVHGHVEGYSDWSILSPAAVSSLRVITGPASPLYGDFSLGGRGRGLHRRRRGRHVGQRLGLELRRRRAAGSGAAAAPTRAASSLAGEGRRQQGWRDNSAYWLGNGTVRGWRRAGSGPARGRRVALRLELGLARLRLASTTTTPTGSTQAMDPTDGGSAYRGIAHGRFTTVAGETGIEATAWVQRVHSAVFLTIPEDGALDQSDEEDRRTAVGGRFQVSRPIGAGDLSAGIDGRADFAAYDLFATADRAPAEPHQGLRRPLSWRRAPSSAGARWSAPTSRSTSAPVPTASTTGRSTG